MLSLTLLLSSFLGMVVNGQRGSAVMSDFVYAGLDTASNMTDRAVIDLDIREIYQLLESNPPNYAAGRVIFMEGKYSAPQGRNGVNRKVLYKLGTQAGLNGNWVNNLGMGYYDNVNFAGDFVRDAFDNTGSMAGLPDAVRVAVIKRGLPYFIMWNYIADDFHDTVDDCEKGDFTRNSFSVDEAWAYYAGSLEGSELVGSGNGIMLFNLAQKRCAEFNTCTKSNTLANVNANIAVLIKTANLQAKRDAPPICHKTRAAADGAMHEMTVPLVQTVIADMFSLPPLSGTAMQVKHAELWTVLQTLLPRMDYCNAAVAQAFVDNFNLSLPAPMKKHTLSALISQLQSIYPCLQITCASVGALSGQIPCVDAAPVCAKTSPIVTTIDRPCAMLRGEEIFGIVFGVLIAFFLATCVVWACAWKRMVNFNNSHNNNGAGMKNLDGQEHGAVGNV